MMMVFVIVTIPNPAFALYHHTTDGGCHHHYTQPGVNVLLQLALVC